MITSGVPDMGLGFEKAAPDVMRRPPQSLKRGVFTIGVMVDMIFYGIWIAALCLGAFVITLYGFEDGQIGYRCNESIEDGCNAIFQARATCFATLTWFSVFLAWEIKQPWPKRHFFKWMKDLYNNKFLFWAVVFGFFTVIPLLYIPVINDRVFKHTGITW